MSQSPSLNESLHELRSFKPSEYFLKQGKPCVIIGQLRTGVMRGYVYDNDGNEITTHFYQKGDMIVGSFMPNVSIAFTIEALTTCEVSVADYAEVMSWVNKDRKITEVITHEFQKLNSQLQSRLVSLLNLSSTDKYTLFLKEYPNLINKIPHYYIANYLGITPTQLSRARKKFIEASR